MYSLSILLQQCINLTRHDVHIATVLQTNLICRCEQYPKIDQACVHVAVLLSDMCPLYQYHTLTGYVCATESFHLDEVYTTFNSILGMLMFKSCVSDFDVLCV